MDFTVDELAGLAITCWYSTHHLFILTAYGEGASSELVSEALDIATPQWFEMIGLKLGELNE